MRTNMYVKGVYDSFVNKKIVKTALLVLWMALIYFFSSRNGAASRGESRAVMNFMFGGVLNNEFVHFLIRKAAHIFIYMVLGILACLTMKEYTEKEIQTAIIICVLYAVSDEVHQYFVPERSMQLSDVILDSIASLAGILLTKLSAKIINERIASKREGI